jgi:hypothetical protein
MARQAEFVGSQQDNHSKGEEEMRFMMIVKGNRDSEAGVMPGPEVFEAMGKYNEELVKAGVLLAGEGLHPTSKGFKVKFQEGGKKDVVDGPFTEAKELVAGFWIIDVKSREEAIEWAKRVPFGPGEDLEVRQVFETSDFEGIAPPEVLEREEELRRKTASGR